MPHESGPSPEAMDVIKKFEAEQKEEEAQKDTAKERVVDEFAMEQIEETRADLEKRYDEMATEVLFDAGLTSDTPEGKQLWQVLMDTKDRLMSDIMKQVAAEQLPLDQAVEILKDKMMVTSKENRAS